MKFKVGDKVRYKDSRKRSWGVNGIVLRKCKASPFCIVVGFISGARHVSTEDLELERIKNQQLLFEFME